MDEHTAPIHCVHLLTEGNKALVYCLSALGLLMVQLLSNCAQLLSKNKQKVTLENWGVFHSFLQDNSGLNHTNIDTSGEAIVFRVSQNEKYHTVQLKSSQNEK